MVWSMFSSNSKGPGDISKRDAFDKLISSYGPDGVSFAAQSKRTDWLSDPLSMGEDADLASFLSQLEEQGFAQFRNGTLSLTWQEAFQIRDSADYAPSFPPACASSLEPSTALFSEQRFFLR